MPTSSSVMSDNRTGNTASEWCHTCKDCAFNKSSDRAVNFKTRLAEVGSNSWTGHFIFYGKVRQCDPPVSQRLTKNSLLQGENVALQRQPKTPH